MITVSRNVLALAACLLPDEAMEPLVEIVKAVNQMGLDAVLLPTQTVKDMCSTMEVNYIKLMPNEDFNDLITTSRGILDTSALGKAVVIGIRGKM